MDSDRQTSAKRCVLPLLQNSLRRKQPGSLVGERQCALLCEGLRSGELVVIGRVLEDNKPNVWSLDTVSGELKQLTFGIDIEKGICTPDGKWLLYNGWGSQ